MLLPERKTNAHSITTVSHPASSTTHKSPPTKTLRAKTTSDLRKGHSRNATQTIFQKPQIRKQHRTFETHLGPQGQEQRLQRTMDNHHLSDRLQQHHKKVGPLPDRETLHHQLKQ